MGLAAAEVYTVVLNGFGGITSPLPIDASGGDISWTRSNFSKLPTFVGKVGDFAALSSTTNFAKTLVKAGCGHVEEMKKKDYESPNVLGKSSKALTTTVRHFMEHSWCRFRSSGCLGLGGGSTH